MIKLNELTTSELELELLKAKKKIKELKERNQDLTFQMKVLQEKYLASRESD